MLTKKQQVKTLGRPKEKLKRFTGALKNYEHLERFGRAGRHTSLFMLGLGLFGSNERFVPRVASAMLMQIMSAPMEIGGTIGKSKLIVHCIGKPRVAREAINSIRNPVTKQTLFILGNGKFNLTEKEALFAMLNHKATSLDKNYADKALQREIKRLNEEGKFPAR